MRGFVRAAGNRDRISRGVLKGGSRIAQMIEKCEAGGFFDPNAPGANVLIGQRGSRDFRGALIFLPTANFDRQVELLAQPSLLKRWNHKDRMAAARDDQANQPLAESPTNSSEVVERCARRKEKRVVLSRLRGRTAGRKRRSGHKLLRPLNTLPKFVWSYRTNAFPQRLKPGKSGRKPSVAERTIFHERVGWRNPRNEC